MSNRRCILKVQRRGGCDNDAALLTHAQTIIGKMFSTRMANTLRITIKLRAGLPRGRAGDCGWRSMKTTTAKSKHHTIRIRRDAPLWYQCRILAHELCHLEQMVTGRLTVRKTYGVYGYFWRARGQRGPATKYDIIDGEIKIPWSKRPWEKEAMAAEQIYFPLNNKRVSA